MPGARLVPAPALQRAQQPLSALAARVAARLKARSTADGKPETIAVFEATTGGLINAALQSVEGASRYYHGGANIYGRMGYKLYPQELRDVLAKGSGRGGTSLGDGSRSNYASQANYHESKVLHTRAIATHMREHLGSTWCIAESGATGPTFAPPDCNQGFTAIAVAGPEGVADVILVQSDTAEREANMWSFTSAAFQLLGEVIPEPAAAKL